MDILPPTPYNVLLLGDACIDRYHYGFCERLSPEAPVPVLRHIRTEDRDGMCLNVRNNLVSLGIYPEVHHNAKLLSKERFVDNKTKQHLMRFDTGETQKTEPFCIEIIKGLGIEKYDAVVISDYNKGFITSKNASVVSEICAENLIPLFVDSKKKDLSCFKRAYFKINQKEYGEITALPEEYEIIVTLGPIGARWKEEVYATAPCEVFDVSGAGDTFLAALVTEFLSTKSLSSSIHFANKCAGTVVQKFGTYVLQKEDLENGN